MNLNNSSKKKPRILNNSKQKILVNFNESLTFSDLLRQPIYLTREISGNDILLGLGIKDSKVILDKELCLLLIAVLKEYCLTNDILNSFEMLREKEE